MVDSTIPCLKELKENPKTKTGFKDSTGMFKELMVEDWDIQKVIKTTPGQFTALASRMMKVSKFQPT